jgi:hypothetical protein
MLLVALLAAVVSLPPHAPGSTPEAGTVRATLMITGTRPLSVLGSGFKAGERVRVSMSSARRQVTAGRRGRFTLRFSANGCNGATIVAVGSKGSRAVVNYSQFVC